MKYGTQWKVTEIFYIQVDAKSVFNIYIFMYERKKKNFNSFCLTVEFWKFSNCMENEF